MPSMTTTEDVVVKKRLRIKYGTKKFEKESRTGEIESAHTVPLIDDWGHTSAVKEKSESTESEGYRVPSAGVQFEDSVKPTVLGFKKRGLEEMSEGQIKKRLKMDRNISHQCSNVLKKLMTHKSGWPFLVPVDPVQLGIPDYFSVIRHPMDLGTVKSKLAKNKYKNVEDFASDVRLTFSNAMTYNPPGNFVHIMAKELNDLFNMLWKSVEKRMGLDHGKEQSMKLTAGLKRSDSTPKLSVKAPGNHPPLTSRSSLSSHKSENFVAPMEIELLKSKEECPTRIAISMSIKGTSNGDEKTLHVTQSKFYSSPDSNVCTICANISCRCIRSKDISSGESLRPEKCKDNHNASKDVLSSLKPACEQMNSDPESDGRTLGDDNACLSYNITTEASFEEDWQAPAMEVQLSPKRALRAAYLKSRFAGTILKAQQKKLLDPGEKVDALKIQQQKDMLERKQREERIRLEAEIKAAEAAARKKAEAERRVQRDKEREAARIALEEMEKTVEFDDTIEALKEIEKLCGCPIYVNSEGEASPEAASSEKAGSLSNPLQQLGLYMKDDCLGGEEEEEEEEEEEDGEISTEVLDGEEGEIIIS